MKPKLLVKLAIMAFSLAALATQAQPRHLSTATNFCRPFAVLCSTNTSAGTCGFRPGQDCNTCYGQDGSTLGGGCPRNQ